MREQEIIGYIRRKGFSLEELFRGKNGSEYYILKTKDKSHEIIYEAYDFSGSSPVSVGFGEIYKTNGKNIDPLNFLALPPEVENMDRWESNIRIYDENHRDLGLGSTLYKYVEREIINRGGLRVVAFSQDGLKYMHPQFVRLGYLDAEVISPERIPSHLQDKTNWMYKIYR